MPSGFPYELWPGGPPPGAFEHLLPPRPPNRPMTPEEIASYKRELQRLKDRRTIVLRELNAAGAPGLVDRVGVEKVPRGLLRRRTTLVEVEAEPAWPVGEHQVVKDARGVWKDAPRDYDIHRWELAVTRSGELVALDGATTIIFATTGPDGWWVANWDYDRAITQALEAIAISHSIALPRPDN